MYKFIRIYCLSTVFALMLLSSNSKAQVYNRIFSNAIAQVGLEFKMPKGFKEKDSVTLYNCGDRKMRIGTIIYSLINKDSSVVIAFFNIMNTGGGKYNPAENIVRTRNYHADSVKNTTFLYDEKLVKSTLNADVAGEFSRNCPNNFLEKYNNNRVVFLANKILGEASIVYFYTDKAKPVIKEIIKDNAKILTFKALKQSATSNVNF